MTWRTGLALLRSVASATRLVPLLACSVLGLMVVAVPILLDQQLEMFDVAALLHLALIILLIGAAYVLDDPARNVVAATAVGTKRVSIIRLALAAALVAPVWIAILVSLPHLAAAGGRSVPLLGLAIEGPALLLWVWAVAAVGGHNQRDGSGGVVAAPFAILSGIVMTTLPGQVRLFSNPDDPGFAQSRIRWTVVLIAGIVAMTAAVDRPVRLAWPRATAD